MDGGAEADDGENRQLDANRADDAAGAVGELARGLDGEPESSVERERDQGDDAADNRVPVENAGMGTGLPVGPQGQEEVAVGLERNAAQDVGEGGSEEDGEQGAGEAEDAVEQRAPYAYVDVVAKLDADAAQDQEPEHDHERQIEAAEGRGVEERKGEVEGAAAGQQPDFVAVPDWADAGEDNAAVGFGANEEEMEYADAQVEAVEHDVGDDHYGDQPEPDETHHGKLLFLQACKGRAVIVIRRERRRGWRRHPGRG